MKSDPVDQEQKLPDYASLSIVLKVQKRVKKNGYSVQFLHDTTLFALLSFSYFCTVKRRAMLPKVCLKKNSLRFPFDNGCLEGIIISYLQYTVCTVGISERRLQPLVRLVTATFYCATQKFSWIYEIQNGNISIYNETQDNTNIIKMHPQGDINDGMKFRDNSR